ncbi:MAG: SOS response-associated peptidase [Burkholderiaceae bacterium]|nr:SOS response-associated peptidase [Burkholderiaceae bacterium]
MCTNYVTTVRDEIRQRLDLEPPTFDYEAELWPGYKGPILIGDMEWRLALFGLVPYFSKDGKDFRRTYNARSETVDSRPTYRGAWRRRQLALVPMNAFFEPDYATGRPIRWRIDRRDGEPFTVAALWDTWRPPGGETLHSFSMLTINADGHPIMGRFHRPGDEKRSLVVVPPSQRLAWLHADDPKAFLQEMPPDEFTSAAAPLPPKARATAPAQARLDMGDDGLG